ncbi:MAG: efflux RND transporter periplasmic adaptor subunit [Sedimentisphaerales bacterium]
MKVIRRILFLLIALTLVFVTYWFGFMRKAAEILEEEKKVPVEVEVVSAGSIEETIELTGWVKANQIVNVASKVAGRVESLRIPSSRAGATARQANGSDLVARRDASQRAVEEGVLVKKGQQLAIIDHDIYLAQLVAAKAGVRAKEVELADAEREKERVIALYEGGSATEQSKDKAVTAAELSAASLSLARANLELAQINLLESTIVSPIDGIVTTKHIDEGNMIRSGDQIVTIADMKTVRVIVAAAEKYGTQITVGMPANIKVDAFAERTFDASVHSVYPALDAQTHTIQVEIRLDNEELLLKPGMFARVTLITKRKDDVVVVPRDVVLGGKIDKPYVYVVEEASASKIARKHFVEIGIKQADRYEITDGLKEGQTLVVNGMDYLADGMTVEVVRIEDIK